MAPDTPSPRTTETGQPSRPNRRVQWAQSPSPHALDEHAQDPAAFAHLRLALEEHREESPTTAPSTAPTTPTLHETRDLGLDVYVEPDERDGLPRPDGAASIERRASRLVKAHQSGRFGGWLRRRKPREPEEKNDDEADIEKRATAPKSTLGVGNMATGPGTGGGVLSANRTLAQASSECPFRLGRPSHSASESPTTGSNSAIQPSPSAGLSLHIPKGLKPSSRPAAARSGGGVFGGLIASTGNITGVATPAASTLGAEAKRPGYHLSRYSADNVVQKAKKSKTAASSGTASPSGVVTPPQPKQETPPYPLASTSDSADGDMSSPDRVRLETSSYSIFGSKSTIAAPETAKAKRSSLHLGALPVPHIPGWTTPGWSTPGTEEGGTPFSEWGTSGEEKRRRRRKEKKKRQEVYTRLYPEARSSFDDVGAPSHRLEAQIQATARVLDIQVSCMYLPSVMLFSFGDTATHTSDTKFLKQSSALDLGKLLDAHRIYWRVIHDQLGVGEASQQLDELMKKRVLYKGWITVVIGGFCSAFITPISFKGSFVDALVAFPLGALLVFVQNLSAKNELYSNFEITIAGLLSFIAGAFAASKHVCYAAVASGSVVLILPGYIVLCGSLDSPLGLSSLARIGAELFHAVSGQKVFGSEDYLCTNVHDANGPWWQRTAGPYWAFLCVPGFSLFLSLRNQSPSAQRTFLISCAGWVTNRFSSIAFPGRSDITSALGSLAVGLAGNLYGRVFNGTAFVVMLTGILFQLPSGLANGGLLSFASTNNSVGANYSYGTGFQVAEQLVSVAVGLTVGLFCSAVLVHPFGGSRRRGGGLFSL
ncbi:pheromone-regulated membrane protein [Rhizoctonia solani]|uniref:Pheromone-regulated membrane protein n=1 Tax=Rhizoctonia solani TaxID=456999 RepID=A0A8H8SZN9_9AGAM|nr:pheromone-regulated membrane protein [Rhizoctonia solani]QRW22812.1 pheromone-regulated membrane protein [Rhizoctonia solani]